MTTNQNVVQKNRMGIEATSARGKGFVPHKMRAHIHTNPATSKQSHFKEYCDILGECFCHFLASRLEPLKYLWHNVAGADG